MKNIFLIAAIGFLIFFAGCISPEPLAPMLSVAPPSYDFGNIPKNGGKISTVFILKNTGKESVEIQRVSTSCGCTVAEMDQSPIPAGGERTLTVIYDPMTHPDEFGLIQRAVYIQNSDSNFPELIIDITGNVVVSAEAG